MAKKKRWIAASRGPHPVDRDVGARLRERRLRLGMSQQQLADAVGVTFQQVQKYENGANRISASRLVELAAALRIGPGWFFEGIGQDVRDGGTGGDIRLSPRSEANALEILSELRGTAVGEALLALARSYLQRQRPEPDAQDDVRQGTTSSARPACSEGGI